MSVGVSRRPVSETPCGEGRQSTLTFGCFAPPFGSRKSDRLRLSGAQSLSHWERDAFTGAQLRRWAGQGPSAFNPAVCNGAL